MDIVGILISIVDIRAQAGRREGNLRMGIFLLDQISVQPCGKSVFTEIIQA